MPECWRASTIVLAAPTYNGGIYLPAANLLEDLKALSLHDRTFALVENGSWAPMSAKLMAAKIGELKNCTVLDAKVTVRGRLTATPMPNWKPAPPRLPPACKNFAIS